MSQEKNRHPTLANNFVKCWPIVPNSFTVRLCSKRAMKQSSIKVHTLKVKVHALDIAPLPSESPPQKRSGMARVLKGSHSFTCTPTRSSAIGMSHTCLPSQPQLVLIYRPRRDGRLSRPWCKVAQAEIRTRNIPIANPVYHTATSAPNNPTTPQTRRYTTLSNVNVRKLPTIWNKCLI